MNSAPPPSASAPLTETVTAPQGQWSSGWCVMPFPSKRAPWRGVLFAILLPLSSLSSPGRKQNCSVTCYLFLAKEGPFLAHWAHMLGILLFFHVCVVIVCCFFFNDKSFWVFLDGVFIMNQKVKGLCPKWDLLWNTSWLGFLGNIQDQLLYSTPSVRFLRSRSCLKSSLCT